MTHLWPKNKKDLATLIALLVLTMALIFVPTGIRSRANPNSVRTKGEVVAVDNSLLRQHGIVKTGEQIVSVKVLGGEFAGQTVKACNHLMGKLEFDKVFVVGDVVLVVLDLRDGKIINANAIDHYRINIEIFLLVLFFILLVGLAGVTGLKAMLSFAFTALAIWKLLLPSFLRGWNPVLVAIGVVVLLTGVIIFAVGGLTRKGLAAFLGALSGVLVTCFLSLLFGAFFKIHGAVKPFSETLLYSGYPHLDLGGIFLAGIFLASSGAMMDVAMDIAASVQEVVYKNPHTSRREVIRSGLEVGKAVIGTMTTTLLLAYTGGMSAMFMVFLAQGTPLINILNIQYVSAEILHTLVGSFGLVTVAPLTAILSGLIFVRWEIRD